MDSMDRKLEAEARARLEGSRHRAMSRADELEARVAELEAEREKLRAVVLAMANHAVKLSEGADDAHEALAVSLEAALGLPPQSEWDFIERALRALAGGVL